MRSRYPNIPATVVVTSLVDVALNLNGELTLAAGATKQIDLAALRENRRDRLWTALINAEAGKVLRLEGAPSVTGIEEAEKDAAAKAAAEKAAAEKAEADKAAAEKAEADAKAAADKLAAEKAEADAKAEAELAAEEAEKTAPKGGKKK